MVGLFGVGLGLGVAGLCGESESAEREE